MTSPSVCSPSCGAQGAVGDRSATIRRANSAGVTYAYDGDGRSVSKVGSKLYWYGSGGDILAETDTSGNTTAEYIFFGGKRIGGWPGLKIRRVLGAPGFWFVKPGSSGVSFFFSQALSH